MRRSGLELSVALAVVSVIAAAMVAWSYDVPLRDPDSATGPMYVRFPALILIVLLLDVIPRIVARASGLRDVRRAGGEVVRERLSMANLRFTFVGLVSWYATYAAVRNLKADVPFANHHLFDADFDRLDRALFLGRQPSAVLHDVLGTHVAAHVLSVFYLLWIAALPISLAVVLVWARRDRISSWWLTAVSIDWLIGVLLNYAAPTVGPIYRRTEDFAGLANTATGALQQSMWDERLAMIADPAHAEVLQNIAAFASLHVAIATTACVVAHRAGLHPALVWGLRAFLAITMVATVYFGWHYVYDVLAGFLLGIVAARLAEVFAAPGGRETEVRSQVDVGDLADSGVAE